jgi:hypothetical protein
MSRLPSPAGAEARSAVARLVSVVTRPTGVKPREDVLS